MQTNKASEAPGNNKRVYEVFEPYCKWRSEDEGPEILEIDLKGFKKEQLKVQVNELGTLIVSGERPVDETNYKWIRFRKETTLPQDCNFKDVRAKLCRGSLSIIMPTKLPHHQKNNDINNKKVTIWGVKIDKGRFLKVAVVVTAVVLAIAVARLTEVYRYPSHDDWEHHHVHV